MTNIETIYIVSTLIISKLTIYYEEEIKMYKYENSVTGNVKAEKVWELYSTVANWSRLDIDVESVSLEGEFVEGSNGMIKMKNGQFLPFTLEKVEVNKSFTNVSQLGDMTISFEHIIKSNDDGSCIITHKVIINGEDESQTEIIGLEIAENIPANMNQLLSLSAKI